MIRTALLLSREAVAQTAEAAGWPPVRQQEDRDRLASGCGRRSRSQPVASHDVADPREVGRPAAGIGEHSGDLAEVVGTEHSRRDDRKRRRVLVAAVIEMMDRAARYAQRLTGGQSEDVGQPLEGALPAPAMERPHLLGVEALVRDGHLGGAAQVAELNVTRLSTFSS